MILMHRVVAGTPDGMECDHIDHDTLNNLPDNLRNCTSSQNKCNSGKHRDNKSGFKGVFAYRKKWRAQIQIDGKTFYIGAYSTPEGAALAYDQAALKYHGEFANLNFPDL